MWQEGVQQKLVMDSIAAPSEAAAVPMEEEEEEREGEEEEGMKESKEEGSYTKGLSNRQIGGCTANSSAHSSQVLGVMPSSKVSGRRLATSERAQVKVPATQVGPKSLSLTDKELAYHLQARGFGGEVVSGNGCNHLRVGDRGH